MTVDGVDETDTVYIHSISYQCHVTVKLEYRHQDLHEYFPNVWGPSTWSFSSQAYKILPPYVICALYIVAIK